MSEEEQEQPINESVDASVEQESAPAVPAPKRNSANNRIRGLTAKNNELRAQLADKEDHIDSLRSSSNGLTKDEVISLVKDHVDAAEQAKVYAGIAKNDLGYANKVGNAVTELMNNNPEFKKAKEEGTLFGGKLENAEHFQRSVSATGKHISPILQLLHEDPAYHQRLVDAQHSQGDTQTIINEALIKIAGKSSARDAKSVPSNFMETSTSGASVGLSEAEAALDKAWYK